MLRACSGVLLESVTVLGNTSKVVLSQRVERIEVLGAQRMSVGICSAPVFTDVPQYLVNHQSPKYAGAPLNIPYFSPTPCKYRFSISGLNVTLGASVASIQRILKNP